MTIAPRARAAAAGYPGRVVLISAAAVLGGFVARIVKSGRTASGRGKTTSLRMISWLVEPIKGRIDLNGRDVGQQHPPSCGGGSAT